MEYPGWPVKSRIAIRKAPVGKLAALAITLMCGCAQQPSRAPEPSDAAQAVQAVTNHRQTIALNVDLVILDPGIPEDESLHRRQGIFPQIREIEARYLPYALREMLVETERWGAVRVLPEADSSAELLVSGTIIKSDGVTLKLQLQAVDSTARVWLNKTYTISDTRVDDERDDDRTLVPFGNLYDEIANDLDVARAQFSDKELSRIVDVSLLRYAETLSPQAFGEHLEKNPAGAFEITRLPAEDDPMLARIQRIRESEYLFKDTVDAQYKALYTGIKPTYDLWLDYRRQLAQYRKSEEERIANEKDRGRRGSFEAMKQTYDNYKWSKLQEQYLQELASGFNNEVEPVVMNLEGRVIRLNGSLKDQYLEWRRILRSIFALETGA